MDKVKITLAIVCVTLALTTVFAFGSRMVILFPRYYKVIEAKIWKVGPPEASMMFRIELHATIKQYRWIDGVKYLIYTYSHPAALTQIGENFTAGKLTGAIFPVTDFMENITYISMGHDVGLTTSSTQLPGEWNRSTSITPEYIGVGHWNLSYSFYPSGSGSTNSTGWNWKSTGNNNLWGYDTFTTIDYTANDQIDVEMEVDIQYS